MDLVFTYESEGSNEDKGKPKSQKQNRPMEEIDIIEITDSDSDTSSPVKSTSQSVISQNPESTGIEVKDKLLNPFKNNPTRSEKEIECIAIDETSDCDDSVTVQRKEKTLNKPNESRVLESDVEKSKKVDYLNLEGSDSDHEQELAREKVDGLLNSAAILCDKPCGPEQSVSRNEVHASELPVLLNKSGLDSHNYLSSSLKNFNNFSQIENKSFKDQGNPCPNNQEKMILPEFIANKRFKRESETPISGENEDFSIPTSFMYRKDERITGAFAKSVVCRLPRQITRNFISHSKIITSLQWCIPQYSHLLLSASVDCSIKIWDMCSKNAVQTMKDVLSFKAAKWSLSGEQIIAGGYGKKARAFDVLSGMLRYMPMNLLF